jgi:hypothetical protein
LHTFSTPATYNIFLFIKSVRRGDTNNASEKSRTLKESLVNNNRRKMGSYDRANINSQPSFVFVASGGGKKREGVMHITSENKCVSPDSPALTFSFVKSDDLMECF